MLFHRLRASAVHHGSVLALLLIPGLVNAQLLDIDADGMPDDWEYAVGLSPSDPFDADLDFDFDGLTNLNEYLNSTHPHLPDSDFDSVLDGDDLFPADRAKALDSDQDGLPDAWELVNGLQPYDPYDAGLDNDYDGLTALEEYRSGTDINVLDTDGDGLPDGMDAFPNDVEYQQDSDEDGLPDKYENDRYFLNPYFPQDAADDHDWDGLTNLEEFQQGTDPDHPDSDRDGSMDRDDPAPIDPQYRFDWDKDGLPDEWEQQYIGNPNDMSGWEDMDGDFLSNLEEYLAGTDPFNHDSDFDGVMDREDHYPLNPQYTRDGDRDGMPYEYEMRYGTGDSSTEDGGYDFDGDLLNNSREFTKGTIPFLPDTDFDGVNDGLDLFPLDRTKALDSDQDGVPDAWEIINGLDPYYHFDVARDDDYDGLTVLQEYRLGTSIESEDTDADFHPDGMDVFPNDAAYHQDSDEDGLPDKYENDRYFLDPYFPQDATDDYDWDGLTNLEEFQQGTDPDYPDSDLDGSMDGDDPAPTDPQYRFDWDKDGLPDEWEQQYIGNPNDMSGWEDMDGDLLSNLEEYLAGTDPFNHDSDFDGVMDREDHYPLNPQYTRDGDRDGMPYEYEMRWGMSDNYTNDGGYDFDGDLLNNSREFAKGTIPVLPDTDFDGVNDGLDLFPLDRTKALDSDRDGLPDVWEIVNNLSPYSPSDAGLDNDYDGLAALQEYQRGTDINVQDTDGDGLPDGIDAFPNDAVYQQDSDEDGLPDKYENDRYFLDPYFPQDATGDHDWDGLTNLEEFQRGTDPDHPDSDLDGSMDGEDPVPMDPQYTRDSDRDGMPDEWEDQNGTNRNWQDALEDFDGDFLSNLEEYLAGTDPLNHDTDFDGVMDREDHYPSNPLYTRDGDRDGIPVEWEMGFELNDNDPYDAILDFDGDGLNNLQEFIEGGDPWGPGGVDADGDGMPDSFEILYGLDPYNANDGSLDGDNDGLSNVDEYVNNTDPTNSDSDGDGMPDGWEVTYQLDPIAPEDQSLDSDGDGLSSLEEYLSGSNPLAVDSDADGINDNVELSSGTNITHPDTDNDGLADGQEVNLQLNPLVRDSDTDGVIDGFQYGSIIRANIPNDGHRIIEELDSVGAILSDDGNLLVFTSSYNGLVANDNNNKSDVFIFNVVTGQTELISVSVNGGSANNWSGKDYNSADIAASPDARYVAFASSASDLVQGVNAARQIYVRDRLNNTTEVVSVNSDGVVADGFCYSPSISRDGNLIAFYSTATNLVTGDTNGDGDIFVHNRQTGQTTRVSVSSNGDQANAPSGGPQLAESGRYVAFSSSATNLVANDFNNTQDVFLHDIQTGQTVRVNVDSGGNESNGRGTVGSISADGVVIAFSSSATNLTNNAINAGSATNVYVHNRITLETSLVSIDFSNSESGNASADKPVVDPFGRYVMFYSSASNLVQGVTTAKQIYVRDLHDQITSVHSINNDGVLGDDDSWTFGATFSGNLHYLAFASLSSNLTPDGLSGRRDIYISETGFNIVDTDDDGIPDFADNDDDNDGVNDVNDDFPLDPAESVDTDSDSIGNNADLDDDNDGIEDLTDEFPLDATEWSDNDADGIGDNADTDDDNDGVLDENDIFPFDSAEWADSDSDGVGDNADAFPNDPGEISDADADGTGDNADPDDDNDSMSDSWEILYGFNPFDAGDAHLDYDSDQYSNLREYQLNSDPLDFASPGSPFLYTDIVQGVSNTGWSLVTLEHQYVSMVVVATPLYDQSYGPMVVRIRNAIDNSFEIKIDRADTSSSAVNVDVHYMVVEEGVYEQTTHGVTMEAVKYLSTLTDQNNSWAGQRRYYQNVYTDPVVIGQVMSANDADYSVFWSRGRSVGKIPDSSYLFVGKHVGEDPDSSRANETVAYIVIETGNGLLNEYRYEAAVGADMVEGIQNGTGAYGLQTVTSPDTAILSQTAMDGSDGSWAILTSVPSANNIYLAVDEDRMKDSERMHTTEQVSYIAFER